MRTITLGLTPWLVLWLLACDTGSVEVDGGPPNERDIRVDVLGPIPDVDRVDPAFSVPASLPPSLQWISVGALSVQGGRSSTVEIDVPLGVQSLTFHMQGHPDALVLLDEAIGPDELALVSPSQDLTDEQQNFSGARGFNAQFFSPSRQVARREFGSARLSMRDDVEISGLQGRWSVRVHSANVDSPEGPGLTPTPLDRPVDLIVLADTEVSDVDEVEVLRIALHLNGVDGLTAATAWEGGGPSPRLEALLDSVNAIYASAGIRIEVDSVHDVPGADSAVVELDPDQGCSRGDLDTLFRSAEGVAGTLPVFFVDRFSCVNATGIDIGAFISGLTGGIPAPVWGLGSPRGGVALATGTGISEADFGELMAHEIGHALGLFHVMETSIPPAPDIFDIISDTLEDEGASQGNLMFPRVNGRTQLTQGQATVARRHPWVRR